MRRTRQCARTPHLSHLTSHVIALLLLSACGTSTSPTGPSRSYRMGFSPLPPRNDPAVVFASLEMWTPRADAGIMHVQLPWAAMLAGWSAAFEVAKVPLGVANYYRAKGLQIVVVLDPTPPTFLSSRISGWSMPISRRSRRWRCGIVCSTYLEDEVGGLDARYWMLETS